MLATPNTSLEPSTHQEILDAIQILQSYFPPDSQRAVKIAKHYIGLNDVENAEKELEPYLNQSAPARFCKATIYLDKKEWEEAWKWLQSCMKDSEATKDEESANAAGDAYYECGRIIEEIHYVPASPHKEDMLDDSQGMGLSSLGNTRFKYEEQARLKRMREKAIALYKEGISKYQHGACYYRLGYLFLKGMIPKQPFAPVGPQKTDHEVAFEYFSKAAEKQSAEAHFQLAQLWESGKGAPKKSRAQAAECFERSARLGNEAAMFHIGLCYLEGRGVKRSADRALHYLKKAKQHKAAITTKGLVYLQKKDYLSALEAFREGAKLKSSKSFYNLGCMYRDGSKFTPQSIQKAKTFFREAASQGNSHALCDLGYFAIQDGNFVEAFRLFRDAKNRGSSAGLLNLARMFEEGQGTKQDIERAVQLYQDALRKCKGSTAEHAKERLEALQRKSALLATPGGTV